MNPYDIRVTLDSMREAFVYRRDNARTLRNANRPGSQQYDYWSGNAHAYESALSQVLEAYRKLNMEPTK